MQEQSSPSKNIIDRRATATHGMAGVVGFLLGLIGTHVVPAAGGADADLVQVVSTALDRGDAFWSNSPGWRSAHVVLIDGIEPTPCGPASSSSGPFYCPPNERIYIDLSFLRAINGDLARAYVIAHELGHHVQKVRGGPLRGSIDVELQADCFAGQWIGNEQINGRLVAGDMDAAIAEADAVGDDRVCPSCSAEQWTHGSSAQRVAAVRSGAKGGTCNAQ